MEFEFVSDRDEFTAVTLAIWIDDDVGIVIEFESSPSEHDDLIATVLLPMTESLRLK